VKESFTFYQNAYWSAVPRNAAPEEQVRDGPFFSRCFDVLGAVVRMHATPYQGHLGKMYVCPKCGKANCQA